MKHPVETVVADDGHKVRKGRQIIVVFDVDSGKITMTADKKGHLERGEPPVGSKFLLAESVLFLMTNHRAGWSKLNGEWQHVT